MGRFGFVFNDDGKLSFGEHMLSMDMMGLFDDEKKQRSVDIDDFNSEMERIDLQDNLDSLESSKSDLEDALFNLEMNEPDILSPTYDSWSAHRDALQDQIDQMDSDISDLEDSLSDLESW